MLAVDHGAVAQLSVIYGLKCTVSKFLNVVQELGATLHQCCTTISADKLAELSDGLMLLAASAKRDPSSFGLDISLLSRELVDREPEALIKIKEAGEALTQAGKDTSQFVQLATHLLNLVSRAAVVVAAFYVGNLVGAQLKAIGPAPQGTKLDGTDAAILLGSTLFVWLPGMGAWGSLAGPIVLATPLGFIATVPLLAVCAVSIGSYIGRRA